MIAARLATRTDLPQLAELRWRLQTDDAMEFDAAERDRFAAAFAQMPDDPALTHFVAEEGGKIIAAMTVRKVKKVPSPRKPPAFWGYLTNCYVLTGHRDKAVGSALLDFVTRWARNEKLELLVVWPSDRSYPFYERKGFRRHADPLVLTLDED